jgi:hypothetical protein
MWSLKVLDCQKGGDMTNNDVKRTLKDVRQIADIMDTSHLNRILKILIDAQTTKGCAFFLSLDVRQYVKKLLSDLIKANQVNKIFNRRQIKQIYEILGDYNIYPVCKLCGQPIKIDSCIQQHSDQTDKMAFSWDHMQPKSLGGSYALNNMQPTHKICNNKRGILPAYNRKLHINIKITLEFDDNMKHRPVHFIVDPRVQYCQNQCCQYTR